MERRLQLQTLLETLIGSRNVYFQPPTSVEMKYPCVIYHRAKPDVQHANNMPYKNRPQYQLKLIDRNPDSPLYQKLLDLPMCSFDRHYTADNLNHDVFNIYF